MPDTEKREKVLCGLEAHATTWTACRTEDGKECPYAGFHDADKLCSEQLAQDALALIGTLAEDIEVWKNRYKWKCIERKNTEDPNEGPNIVKIYTSEEIEQSEKEKDRAQNEL